MPACIREKNVEEKCQIKSTLWSMTFLYSLASDELVAPGFAPGFAVIDQMHHQPQTVPREFQLQTLEERWMGVERGGVLKNHEFHIHSFCELPAGRGVDRRTLISQSPGWVPRAVHITLQ